MRFPHFLSTLPARFRRLRDPQVQVWVMAGMSVLLLLIGQVRAWSPSGEGKNEGKSAASRLLLAGPRVTWTEASSPSPLASRRPVLVLQGPASPIISRQSAPPSSAPAFDCRAAMQEASGKPWQFLDRPLRRELATTIKSPGPLQVRLSWSGDRRGNAALLATHPKRFNPSAALVIGNGSRSGDGRIESLPSRLPPMAEGLVEITLIGQGSAPTARQSAALGELLNHLEALSGHPLRSGAAAPTGLARF